LRAVETQSRKKKQDEAEKKIDETTERFSNDTSITHPIDFSEYLTADRLTEDRHNFR
jgi:hypothetical protein